MTKEAIRQGIPDTFLSMAQSLTPSQVNYQRTQDRARSQIKNMQIPDMTRGDASLKRTVTPTEVALPYRYIPSNPKT